MYYVNRAFSPSDGLRDPISVEMKCRMPLPNCLMTACLLAVRWARFRAEVKSTEARKRGSVRYLDRIDRCAIILPPDSLLQCPGSVDCGVRGVILREGKPDNRPTADFNSASDFVTAEICSERCRACRLR